VDASVGTPGEPVLDLLDGGVLDSRGHEKRLVHHEVLRAYPFGKLGPRRKEEPERGQPNGKLQTPSKVERETDFALISCLGYRKRSFAES
jgi:hypothetical protein